MKKKMGKADKAHLDMVAQQAGGMVSVEKVRGVSRKEQVALGMGIALGITYVTDVYGRHDSGVAREDAARLVVAGMESLPAHRDELLSKSVADAVGAVVVERGR